MRAKFFSFLIVLVIVGAVVVWIQFRPKEPEPDPRGLVSWPEPSNVSSPSHQKMLATLAEIVAKTNDENIFFGDKHARQLRAELADPPTGTSVATIAKLKTDLAKAELKLGNEREAIILLLECERELIPKVIDGLPMNQALNVMNSLRFDLGVALMRKGESDNCCQRNTPESCIMPIQGEGIHTRQNASRSAIRCFEAILKRSKGNSPGRLRARWLLNIAYMTVGDYPEKVPEDYLIPLDYLLPDEPYEYPPFKNSASKLGLDTFSLAGGVIADDFDNDGYLDLVVSSFDSDGQIRFFQNQGDGTFTDRTEEAGLTGIVGGLNLVQGDFDNDGWTDILVLRGAWLGSKGRHPNSLLRNDGVPGIAQFTDVTHESGLAEVSAPTQTAAWADYDNDGDLDLYIGNESLPGGETFPCQLFRNSGDGTFTDQASLAGVTNERFTKAVVWGDYDGDRYPDLYVSNLDGENRLYHNEGNGTFRDLAPELRVTAPHASFPAWFWDFNNDGVLDIYASGYAQDIAMLAADALSLPHSGELARLYRGDGMGGFVNVTEAAGLTRPNAPMGSNFGDLNGDGYSDFYLGTGEPKFMNLMPNLMYVNQGGERFVDVSRASGLAHLQKGHAVAFADFDNDGDQDLFEQLGGAFPGDKFFDAYFENPGTGSHWISVKLVGKKSNRSAIGARIRVDVAGRSIYQWVNSGGSFGANPLRQNIGLGESEKITRLEVFWPTTGEVQEWTDVPLDTFIEITEGDDQWLRKP